MWRRHLSLRESEHLVTLEIVAIAFFEDSSVLLAEFWNLSLKFSQFLFSYPAFGHFYK